MKGIIYFIIFCIGFFNNLFCQKKDTIHLSSKENISSVFDRLNSDNNLKYYILNLKNDGIYKIKKTIVLNNKIEILGNNSTLQPDLKWNENNDSDSPMFAIVGKNNISLKDLIIDFQGQKRTASTRIYCGVLILASNHVTIENVKFKNGGLNSVKSIPNSPYILIASQDKAGDVPSLPKKYKNKIGSCSNNFILNNTFENIGTSSRFGIRVLSNWLKKRPHSNFKNKSFKNIIKGNSFVGEFSWNTVELAGGGTVENKVINNRINGKSVNALDIDKGASFNSIESNIILNAGLPERYRNDKNIRCSPISVQGSNYDYVASSNQVLKNTIENVSNPPSDNKKYYYSSAIMTSYVKGVLIEGNIIRNVYQDSAYQGGKNYGFGIVLHDFSNDVEIKSNRIEKVYIGIAINWVKKDGSNITIDRNYIDFVSDFMRSPKYNVKANIFKIKNNQVKKIQKK